MSTGATQRLLAGPIVPTIARLAAPGMVLAGCQSAASVADTYFVARGGTDALAGLAVVFPLVVLLQMTSAGAMGGAVASAVARARGAGDQATARRLVVHALVIALGAGLGFTVALIALGGALYALLGGAGPVLAQALAYSHVLFGGAVVVWLANTLASVLRGTGNTLTPALCLAAAALLQIPLAGALVLGWGPLPRLGISGAAIAYVAAFLGAGLVMGVVIWRGPLRPRGAEWRLDARLFRQILRVGALSSISSVQTVLTAVLVTGLVGRFGAGALAGYGVGLRLELQQVPLVFAIGQALVVLVGTNIGAGQGARARRIAWLGTAMAAGLSLSIGLFVAAFPGAWIHLFSDDPTVLRTGTAYLRIVAPFYGLLGAGLALFFAAQGVGKMLLSVLAGTARLSVVVVGGALVATLDGPLAAMFGVVAGGIAVFGTLLVTTVRRARWGAPPA